MESICSVDELIEALPKCVGSEFIALAQNLNLKPDDFDDYAFWLDDGYTRNCISRNDHYELILLCWAPGQKTAIHDHNGEECWVYGISGELREERFERTASDNPLDLKISEVSSMLPGQVAYMNDKMGYHSLENVSAERAMSLHLYVNPIDACEIVDPETEKFVRKELSYHSLEGKLL